MSAKQTIKRLENHLNKTGGSNRVTVKIPYLHTSEETSALQDQLIKEHNLGSIDLVVFVVDYALAA